MKTEDIPTWIPKSLQRLAADPRVEDIFQEDNQDDRGRKDWWVWLSNGYCLDPGNHSIHEWSVRDVVAASKLIQPCNCDDCEDWRKHSSK